MIMTPNLIDTYSSYDTSYHIAKKLSYKRCSCYKFHKVIIALLRTIEQKTSHFHSYEGDWFFNSFAYIGLRPCKARVSVI